MPFSDRNKIKHKYPPRDVYEVAPERVRSVLNTIVQNGNTLAGYHRLCEMTGRMPDGQIWGDDFASPLVSYMIEKLEWWEVFDLLEEVCDGDGPAEKLVNEAFAREGLSYEMVDAQIWTLDEEGDALEVTGTEYDAEKVLVDKFEPARKQWRDALEALNGRPAELEKAISESVGAMEAVAHILTGESNFNRAVSKLLSEVEAGGALAASMNGIYNYASQVPGARHGRHAEPDTDLTEARYVVRTAAHAIVYMVGRFGSKS